MKRSNWRLVLSVAVCALLPVITVSAKNVVQRPFKAHGQTVIAIDLSQAYFDPALEEILAPWSVVEEVGNGTHTGLWTSQGGGTVYFDPELNPLLVAGSGFITVASGEVITWESPGGGLVVFTGGKGRFAKVSGSFTQVQNIIDEVQIGPFIYLTIEWTGSGTIAY